MPAGVAVSDQSDISQAQPFDRIGNLLDSLLIFRSSANSGRMFVPSDRRECHECSSCLVAMTSGPPTNRTNASAVLSLSPTDRCNRYWTVN